MSTKIFNGYVFTENLCLYRLREKMNDFRTEVRKVIRKLHLYRTARMAVNEIDNIAMGKHIDVEYGQDLLQYVENEIGRRHKEVQDTKRRDPEYDFSCNAEIIPIKGKTLLLAYADQLEILKVFDKQTFLKPYPYWNNVDPDKDVSEKEWNQREEDWEEALPGVGIPSENGFNVSLDFTYLPMVSFKDVLKVLRRKEFLFEARCFKLARYQAWGEISKQKWDAQDEDAKISKTQCVLSAERMISEGHPKAKELIAQLQEEIAGQIPREITKELLLQKLDARHLEQK